MPFVKPWSSIHPRSTVVWSLTGLLLLGFLTRLHTFNEPLENDLAEYAVVGHELLNGRELYSDIFQNRPPVIYLTYAFAEKLVGYGQQEAFFLGWIAFALTLLGVYRAGSMGHLGEKGGLWAALFWTVLSSDMFLQANQPNTEVFMNICVVWIFFLLTDQPSKPWKEWMAGALLAIGTFYKPFMLLLVIVVFLGKTIFDLKKKNVPRGAGFLVRFLAPGLGLWAAWLGYLALTDRLKIYLDIMFAYNSFYAGNVLENCWRGLKPDLLFPEFTWVLLPIILLTAAGFFLEQKKNRSLWFFLAAFMVGNYLMIACPGKFFPHYYQLWLPLLCVGGGWGAVLAAKKIRSSWKDLGSAPAFLCLGLVLTHEIPNYHLDADGWSYQKYGNDFIEARRLGESIGRILEPDELLFFWGDNADLYFYSRKSPPTGIIITWTAFFGPLAPTLTDRMFKDLERNKPDMVVFNDRKFHDFYKHFLNKYRVWKYSPRNGRFIILLEKGGKLEKRLSGVNS
jgi:hypothetical protein